jgi:hypothetical protein
MSITTKSIVHGLVGAVLFGLSMFMTSGNPALGLTVGGVLTFVYHAIYGWYTTV